MDSSNQQAPALLTSWKEIAAYLGKGVRTVQRWEVQLGLPVRRPNRSDRGIVQVSREELDRWLKSQWSQGRHSRRESNPEDKSPKELAKFVVDLESVRNTRHRHSELIADVKASMERLSRQCDEMRTALEKTRGEHGSRLRHAG